MHRNLEDEQKHTRRLIDPEENTSPGQSARNSHLFFSLGREVSACSNSRERAILTLRSPIESRLRAEHVQTVPRAVAVWEVRVR